MSQKTRRSGATNTSTYRYYPINIHAGNATLASFSAIFSSFAFEVHQKHSLFGLNIYRVFEFINIVCEFILFVDGGRFVQDAQATRISNSRDKGLPSSTQEETATRNYKDFESVVGEKLFSVG